MFPKSRLHGFVGGPAYLNSCAENDFLFFTGRARFGRFSAEHTIFPVQGRAEPAAVFFTQIDFVKLTDYVSPYPRRSRKQ